MRFRFRVAIEACTLGGAVPVSVATGPDAPPTATNVEDMVDLMSVVLVECSVSVVLVEGSFLVDCVFSFREACTLGSGGLTGLGWGRAVRPAEGNQSLRRGW